MSSFENVKRTRGCGTDIIVLSESPDDYCVDPSVFYKIIVPILQKDEKDS